MFRFHGFGIGYSALGFSGSLGLSGCFIGLFSTSRKKDTGRVFLDEKRTILVDENCPAAWRLSNGPGENRGRCRVSADGPEMDFAVPDFGRPLNFVASVATEFHFSLRSISGHSTAQAAL